MSTKTMVKKTRYELIKSTPNFTELVFAGVINSNISNWITVYEYFINCLNSHTNPRPKDRYVCVTHTQEYFNNKISESMIYRIIKYMES